MTKPNPYIAWLDNLEAINKRSGEFLTEIPLAERINGGPFLDWDAYTAEDIASWWLQDDWTLSGPGMRPERIAGAIVHLHFFGDYDFIRLVQKNWKFCDSLHQHSKYFADAFMEAYTFGHDIEKTMKGTGAANYAWWSNLPENLTVYSCSEENFGDGLLWTLDFDVALEFAKAHPAFGEIYQAKVKKQDVWFASNERDEAEIVWDAIGAQEETGIEFERVY